MPAPASESASALRDKAPSSKGRSEPGVDVYRGAVVILMFAVHARRIQARPSSWFPTPNASWLERGADSALEWLMWAEPYIAASFLFLVGYSLVLSHQAALSRHAALSAGQAARNLSAPEVSAGWRARMTKRAGWLYLLSLGLFVPQFGLQWPDFILSSGILSAIALGIVCCAAAIAQPASRWWSWLGIAIVLSVTSGLHLGRATVSGLNAGPGGAFPLLAAAFFGVLAGRLSNRGEPTHGDAAGAYAWTGPALAALAALWSIWVYRLDGPWIETLRGQYLDYGGVAVSYWLEHGLSLPTQRSPVAFWNHTSLGMLYLFALLWLSLRAARGVEALPRLLRGLGWLQLLGRHALLAYVMHLGALGVLELVDAAPGSSLGTWLLVSTLTGIACALGAVVEWRGTRASVERSHSA